MNSNNYATLKTKPVFMVSISEILLLCLSFCTVFFVIFSSNLDYAFNTILLFIVVTFLGLYLIKRTVRSLADYKLKILGSFWLFKIIVTALLLYLGWMPELEDFSSDSWGYDPQRYYLYSKELIENDWVPTFGLNYMGIVYYYGSVFAIIGRNPLIPSLINIFISLLGVLFLIRTLYAFKLSDSRKNWRVAYLLLIPEVLWYDVMTSRETLMATMILVLSLFIGRYMVKRKDTGLFSSWLTAIVLFVGILSVRATMIIPLLFGTVLMFLFLTKSNSRTIIRKVSILVLIFFAIIVAFIGAPIILDFIGTSTFNFSHQFNSLLSANENIATNIDGWNDRSIGLLLLPEGPLQALLFLPFRMILYLIAPLPSISVTFSGLISGQFSAWQNLMTLPTSLLMTLLFPYVLSGSSYVWKQRRLIPGALIIPIAFWVNFSAVAGGNLIIHERYRLMFTLLFFACVWIGYTHSSRASKKYWAFVWFCILSSLTLFYIVYKAL